MKIREIRALGLRGASPEGGWSEEIRPDDCVHTLIAVFTDEGVTGYGSVFTNDGLVKAALHVLEPLYRGKMRWNRNASVRNCTRIPFGSVAAAR